MKVESARSAAIALSQGVARLVPIAFRFGVTACRHVCAHTSVRVIHAYLVVGEGGGVLAQLERVEPEVAIARGAIEVLLIRE